MPLIIAVIGSDSVTYLFSSNSISAMQSPRPGTSLLAESSFAVYSANDAIFLLIIFKCFVKK